MYNYFLSTGICGSLIDVVAKGKKVTWCIFLNEACITYYNNLYSNDNGRTMISLENVLSIMARHGILVVICDNRKTHKRERNFCAKFR